MTKTGNRPIAQPVTAETICASRPMSRTALMGGAALAALAIYGARSPVRAGNTAVVINSTPSNSTYINSGVINGSVNGVIVNVTVNTFTNNGTITGGSASGAAIGIFAGIGTLTNSGTLSAPIGFFDDFAGVGTFINNGKILGNSTGIQTSQNIGLLSNSGTIQGANTWGLWNVYYGTGIGTLNNYGTITGAVSGIINTNKINTLTNTGLIQNTGYYSKTGIWGVTAAIWNYGNTSGAGTIGTLTNSGTITGPQYGIASNGQQNTNYHCTPFSCTPTGISIYTATISSIANSGTINGGKYGIYNGVLSTFGTITNSGKILGGQGGIVNDTTIGGIFNSVTGTISGGQGPYGIYSTGSIGSINNYGTVSSQNYGIYNRGEIGPLNNFSGATITGGNGTFGVYNAGSMGSVVNGGMIIAAGTALYNSGAMGAVTNTGTISSLYNASGRITGGATGVSNTNQLSRLTNTGVISGTAYGVSNSSASGSISSLANMTGGTITGGNTGIYNTGSIGTLSNSGVLSGSLNAINSVYQLTNILNSGTISGNISVIPVTSAPYQAYITITGATTNAIGTLTGGNINTAIGNLTLVQNTLLEDNIFLPASSPTGIGKAVNYGQLTLQTTQTIYGNFQNASGGTVVLSGGASLIVTGVYTDPPESSTGTVVIQASNGDASPMGTQVIAQSAVPIDASMATVSGLGYSVSNLRTVDGPGGTYLLVGDLARTDFILNQDGNLVVQDLAGSRALFQSGTGSTYLVGQNTYTGPTTVTSGVLGIVGTSASPHYAVTGGTLRIDGSASGVVSVGSGGTLSGSGMFGGGTIGAGGVIAPANIAAVAALAQARSAGSDPVAVEAALAAPASFAPGVAVSLSNPAGNLVSNGNLTLGAGSTYRVGVTANGLSDHLLVNGQANLQGGAVEVRALPGNYAMRTAYTIVTATDGVVGTFGPVVTDLAFLTPTLSYDPNDVFLTLRRNDVPYTAVAATQNQYAVASGLHDAFARGLSPAGGAVIDAFTLSTVSQAQAALDQISGEGIAAAQTAVYSMVNLFADATRDRAMEWVMGEMPVPWKQQVASDDSSFVPGPADRRLRAWAAALGGGSSIDGVSGVGSASVTTRGGGGVAGMDYQVDQDLLIGLSAGGTSATYNVSQRNTSGQQTGGLAALYAVARADNFYAFGLLNYGGFGTRSTRTLMGLGGTEFADGNLSSNAFTARLEAGYRIDTPNVNVTPYIALQGPSLQNAGFTETSQTASGQPGSLGLAVQSRTTSSVPGSLGFQLDQAFSAGDDWVIRPVLRLAWRHEFSTSRSISAGLTVLPGSLWTVQSASAAPDAADIGLSLQMLNRNGISVAANLGAYAAQRSSAYQGQIGISYRW